MEPLAVAVHAVRKAEPHPGQAAVVLGLGPIGLQTAQALLAHGASPVIGVDLSPLRRSIGSQLGVKVVEGAGDVRTAVERATGVREVAVVAEATGAPALVQLRST